MTCVVCSSEFYPRWSDRCRGTGRFCSRICASAAMRKPPRPPRKRTRRVGVNPRTNVSTFQDRFWARVIKTDGCWEWTAARFTGGYGKVALPGTRRLDGAHRVAWRLTNGAIPDGLWVLHKCDNRPCCRPDHLFLGTCEDNIHDAMAKGRMGGGGRSGSLTEATIQVIRRRAAGGESHRSIARELEMDRRTIDRIVARQIYKQVA